MKNIKALDMWSALLVLALALVAGRVAVILAAGRTAWLLIVGYWALLTAKNVIDFIRGWHQP